MEKNEVKKIGVIGAGVMGTGVAQRFATYGYDVLLIDVDSKILDKSVSTIKRTISIHNMMHKEKINAEEVMGHISVSLNYGDLKDSDIVIENVPEIYELKEKVYLEIEKYCKKECLYLVNTSCISITKIGSLTKRADQVIGVHFMNPVPMQKFSEVIKGYYTSDETIEKVKNFLKSAGINCTVINDSPGFVSNRLSHIFMNEAANLVLEGVADAKQIDEIFTQGFHHEMGPLQTADLIGIDTVVNSLDVLYESYHDPKFRCSPLLRKMVDANLLGRKTGKGFFEY